MTLCKLLTKHFGARPTLTETELLVRRLNSVEKNNDNFLGKGSFGKVWKITDKTGFTFALKETQKESGLKNKNPNREYQILKTLQHRRILRVYGFTENESTLNLAMEYMDGGTLQNKIDIHGKLQLQDFYELFEQIMDGLNCLHSNEIVHNDIKPENILCAADGSIKLSDSGQAKHFKSSSSKILFLKQSEYYVSPEVAASNLRTTQSDIWSVGATAVCMLRGNPPHYEKNVFDALQAVINYEIDDKIPEESQQASQIIKQCFKRPQDRPTAESLWNEVKQFSNKVPEEASDDWKYDEKCNAIFIKGLKQFKDAQTTSKRELARDVAKYVARLVAVAVVWTCVFLIAPISVTIDFSWHSSTIPSYLTVLVLSLVFVELRGIM